MHPLEFDIGRVLKALGFTLACALLMLVPYPLLAQEPTPSPGSLIRDTTDAIQTLSPLVVALIVVVVVLALMVVFFVVIAARTVSPAFGAIQSLMGQVNAERQERENERQERQMVTQKLSTALTSQSQASAVAADQRAQTAEALERTANILNNLETRDEATKRQKSIQDNTDGNTDKINTHTDDTIKQAVAPIGEGIGDIKKGLERAIEKLDAVATRDQLEGIIAPISDGLKGVVERVGNLEDTIQAMIDSKHDLPVLRRDDDPPSSSTIPVPFN